MGVGVRGGFVEAVDVVAGFDGEPAEDGGCFVVVVVVRWAAAGLEQEEERENGGL